MRPLSLSEVIQLHEYLLEQSGGITGIRDLGALESAVAQPHMTFRGVDLYQTIQEKAATLCFSLVTNHPFVDGNKRVGHAAMETFLVLNNWELDATVDVAERTILALADGTLSREEFVQWVNDHSKPR
jgi:death-on-curing protein